MSFLRRGEGEEVAGVCLDVFCFEGDILMCGRFEIGGSKEGQKREVGVVYCKIRKTPQGSCSWSVGEIVSSKNCSKTREEPVVVMWNCTDMLTTRNCELSDPKQSFSCLLKV